MSRKEIKIIHTADSHLCDQQYGRRSRGQAFTDSLFKVVEIAMAHGAKTIVSSGDLLNTKKPSSKNIKDILALNKRLAASGVKFLTITGNHDKCEPSWVSVLCEEAGQAAIQVVDLDWKVVTISEGSYSISLYGVPDCSPSEFRAKSPYFPDADILVAHAPIKEFAAFPMGDEALSIKDLPTEKYKAILLGDIHVHDYKNIDGCLVGYPGSTEFCRRSEPVDKFVSLITFEEGQDLKRESIPLPQSNKIMTFDIKSEEDIPPMLEKISQCKSVDPVVLIRKNPEFTDIFSRVAAMLDLSKAILRVRNLPKSDSSQFFRTKRDEDIASKTPRDFVCEYFPEDTKLFELASSLCERHAKPAPLIEEYIDAKLRYENSGSGDKKFRSP